MPRGEVENISGAQLTIESLGWIMPTAHIEPIDETSAPDFRWVKAEPELAAKITAGDLVIRSETGLIIGASGIIDWIGANAINTPQQHILTVFLKGDVKKDEDRFLSWNDAIKHTEVPWPAYSTYTILRVTIGVKEIDPNSNFGVKIYAFDDLNTPVYTSPAVLPVSSLTGSYVLPLSPPSQLTPDDYAFSMYRSGGPTYKDSQFNEGVLNFFLRREN